MQGRKIYVAALGASASAACRIERTTRAIQFRMSAPSLCQSCNNPGIIRVINAYQRHQFSMRPMAIVRSQP